MPREQRSMQNFGSYAYCEEAREEDRRVETVRPFCLPERWWGQRAEHRELRQNRRTRDWRVVKRTLCRTNRTFSLHDRPGRVPSWRPQFPESTTHTERVEDAIELLTLQPEDGTALRYLAVMQGDDAALAAIEEALWRLRAQRR